MNTEKYTIIIASWVAIMGGLFHFNQVNNKTYIDVAKEILDKNQISHKSDHIKFTDNIVSGDTLNIRIECKDTWRKKQCVLLRFDSTGMAVVKSDSIFKINPSCLRVD